MSNGEETTGWREIVAEMVALHDDPDPHAVADDVVAKLDDAQAAEALADLMPYAVRQAVHAHRVHEQRTRPSSAEVGSKWAAAAEMQGDPTRMRDFVPGVGWKFRADLTADDCDAIADGYDQRAAANRREAERFRGWAHRLRAAGAETLADYWADQAARLCARNRSAAASSAAPASPSTHAPARGPAACSAGGEASTEGRAVGWEAHVGPLKPAVGRGAAGTTTGPG